jgi:hypothetical protein
VECARADDATARAPTGGTWDSATADPLPPPNQTSGSRDRGNILIPDVRHASLRDCASTGLAFGHCTVKRGRRKALPYRSVLHHSCCHQPCKLIWYGPSVPFPVEWTWLTGLEMWSGCWSHGSGNVGPRSRVELHLFLTCSNGHTVSNVLLVHELPVSSSPQQSVMNVVTP